MPIPPILDVFVVWHPDDRTGAERFADLNEHFHSPAFSGLAGGAVEVYARSEPWVPGTSAPRPLGIDAPLGNGLPPAQFNAIVPIIDTNLARAVADASDGWGAYIHEIAALNHRDGVGVYPLVADGFNWANTVVNGILGEGQTLPTQVNLDSGLFGRELAQAITQHIQLEAGLPTRLKVFVSHTKHRSTEEAARSGPAIFESVREHIAQTHLTTFFDAQDIQPGEDWEQTLEGGAASSALLMVRTDVYAGRDWTQREVRTAKRSGMPVVCMYALTAGEERGSFLMDHVPSVVCDLTDPDPGIEMALNRLVDEALKNTLWREQTSYLSEDGFDWLPAQSPEPTTLAPWLAEHQEKQPDDDHIWVIHPDPPLGPAERGVLLQLCALAGYDVDVDIFTPRTFAARGGALRQ
ncbi:MAG: toll/interleukin-1 receptor domain-containing protein [Salinibacterium sp.]|nr:toll/interleukin-1 receptor domain-containing protein [Salinibacterium sp.]